MVETQQMDHDKLLEWLMKLSIWTRIHENRLITRKRWEKPAKIANDALSQVHTYYDGNNKYTLHRVITKDGKIIHEDIKDAYINGIRYEAVKNRLI